MTASAKVPRKGFMSLAASFTAFCACDMMLLACVRSELTRVSTSVFIELTVSMIDWI